MKVYFAVIGTWMVSVLAYGDGVTWEEQAERLQNVNASFLDSVPFGDPIGGGAPTVGLRAVVTFLPKVNPKVGAKSEDVPTAPAHLIPILDYAQQVYESASVRASAAAHVGFLPAGGEKLLGLTASLTQYLFGATAQLTILNIGGGAMYFPLGLQISHAEVSGNITEKHSNDEFIADTRLLSGGVGYSCNEGKYWSSLLFINKSTLSKFDIEVDATSIQIEDTLSDGALPFAVQIGGGLQVTPAIKSGLAYLWVPERFNTGRLLLNYGFTF